MKEITAKLEGITPILFSRMTEEEAKAIQTGIRTPIVPDRDPREIAEKKLYTKDGKSGIPYHMFFACLVEAGRRIKLNPRSNITSSRGTQLTSFLRLKGDFYPFEDDQGWEADVKMGSLMVRGQRVAAPVIRPRFDRWSFIVSFEMDEKRVSEETVKALFEEAGRVGLGSWRPSESKPGPYGQFRIAEWEVKDIEGATGSPRPSPKRGSKSRQ